jgi:hypothetical protein
MPCAPPKEEEVRVGYLKYHLTILYVKKKKWFKQFFVIIFVFYQKQVWILICLWVVRG